MSFCGRQLVKKWKSTFGVISFAPLHMHKILSMLVELSLTD